MKKFLPVLILFSFFSGVFSGEDLPSVEPTYKEIPYYLNKLSQTQLEEERIKFDKIIHDAVVNSDLSSKRVVKEMTPLIKRISEAIGKNLDRTNLAGQTGWLVSAIDFYNREKLIKFVDVPETERLTIQLESKNGTKITPFPDRIMVYIDGKPDVLVKSTNIHEAVISPDGRRIAFFRLIAEDSPRAEIWVYSVKDREGKKVSVVPSCFTLLFSLDGKKIYFQMAKEEGQAESEICVVSAGGGNYKRLSEGALLQSIVGSGRYRGCLIILKKTYSHLGSGGQDCGFLFRPDGEMAGKLTEPVCN